MLRKTSLWNVPKVWTRDFIVTLTTQFWFWFLCSDCSTFCLPFAVFNVGNFSFMFGVRIFERFFSREVINYNVSSTHESVIWKDLELLENFLGSKITRLSTNFLYFFTVQMSIPNIPMSMSIPKNIAWSVHWPQVKGSRSSVKHHNERFFQPTI